MKIYGYNGRNPEEVSGEEEEKDKRKIDGFTRLFREG